MSGILYFNQHDIERLLDYPSCIEAMRSAMALLSDGHVRDVPRSFMDVGEPNRFGVMQGAIAVEGVIGVKLLGLYPDNPRIGKSSHPGLVALFDIQTGDIECLVDASSLTAIRTAAASAAATAALARQDARVLAILGSGEQALSHACAMATVRPIDQVNIWSRSLPKADFLANRLAEVLGVKCHAAPSVAEAVSVADIICTTTGASKPVLLASQVRPGTHINVVGFPGPTGAEVDVDLVAAARYFGDHRETVLREAGELLQAMSLGRVPTSRRIDEIGELFLGRIPGRLADTEITLYRSCGHVAQDILAASRLLSISRGEPDGAPIEPSR